MGSAGKQRQDKKAPAKTKESITPTPDQQQSQVFSEKADSRVLEGLAEKPGAQKLRQATLLQMQRNLGNAAVGRMIAGRKRRSVEADLQSRGEPDFDGLENEQGGPPSLAPSPPADGSDSVDDLDGLDGSKNGSSSPSTTDIIEDVSFDNVANIASIHTEIQRQDESGGEQVSEAEKAAALDRAKAASSQASKAADTNKQEVAKSKKEKANKKQAGLAAKQKQAQATGAEKAKGAGAEKKKGEQGKKGPGPAKQKGVRGAKPPGPVGAQSPGPNGAGPASDARTPTSPDEDPGFQSVVKQSKQVADKESSHEPAGKKSQEAQIAAEAPADEKMGKAEANKVAEMAAVETPNFDKAAFKAQLMERIQALAPKTASEADDFKESGKLDGLKGEMKGKVDQEKESAQDPVEQKAQEAPDPGSVPAKPSEALPSTDAGPEPAKLGAEAAVPKKKGRQELEKPIQESSKSIDQQMAESDITEEQLEESNEPEFQSALGAKREAQQHAQEAPVEARQEEQSEIETARSEAVDTAQERTGSMHEQRGQLLEQVADQQTVAKTEDEGERARIGAEMQQIYEGTKSKVEEILGGLDVEVAEVFDAGAAEAKRAFGDFVDARMTAYKEERYGGWLGWAKWAKDKLLGMPSEVNGFYNQGRQLYLSKMDAVIDQVVAIIGTGLSEAKAEIAKGRQKIQDYLTSLPEELQKIGSEAAENIQGKFDELEQSVNDKEGELIDSLANKYQEHLQSIDAQIEDMKAANKGLVDKAVDAVAGVVRTIIELKNMLLNVFSRVADVVGKIIKAPVKFLGNLLGAVKEGFERFVGNIGEHLKKGFIGWLTGAMGDAGIQLPETFDLKGVFQLVMQLLGLTFDKLRQRIVKVLGFDPFGVYDQIVSIIGIYQEEGLAGLAKAGLARVLGPEKLEALMQVVEIIDMLRGGNFGAIWDLVEGQLANLKEMVFGKIQEFLIEKVIKSAVTWLISLFNPAGAFIKAVKLIYDVIMFFIERGKQIMSLINAIIDSVASIVSGNLGGAAALIENALSKAVPVAISFLASLLGLGGVTEKVREVIESVRGTVEKALDAVFNSKPVQMVGGFIKKVVGKVTGLAKSGAAKVKGFAKAGAAKVKGLASKGASKVKGALGMGGPGTGPAADAGALTPTEDGAVADQDSEQSILVKDKAKRKVLNKSQEPFESRQDLNEAVHQVEQELKPEGLKSLKIKPKKDKEGKFGILAEASEEEEITEVEVESGKNAAGPYGLEPLDPEEAGIPSIWLKHPPPASGGAPVKVYRGFSRNASKHINTVVRPKDVGGGGILSRDPAAGHDAVFNQVGREAVLTGENQAGVVEISIPGDLWDALADTNHISERSYPGFSRDLNSTEIRINSDKARSLIMGCSKTLLPPDSSFSNQVNVEDLLKLLE